MKPTEKDLARGRHRFVVFGFAWFASLFPMMMLIAIIAVFVQRILNKPITGAWTWIVYGAFLIVPAIPGLLLLHYRQPIILRFDFKWTCLAGLVGRVLRIFALVALIAIIVIVYVPNVFSQKDPLYQLFQQVKDSTYLGIASIVGLIVLGAGGATEGYFDAFPPIALAKLYFGQAKETRACDEKLRWIDSGLDSIREAASEFGLDFDSSWFKQNYAVRLFDGQNVDKELDQISTGLSHGHSILAAIGQMGAITSEQFKLIQSTRNRVAVMVRNSKDLIQILLALLVLSLEAVLKLIFHF